MRKRHNKSLDVLTGGDEDNTTGRQQIAKVGQWALPEREG